MYSESTGNVYFFVCKLFNNNDSTSSCFTKDGFSNWKKSEEKVRSHENSPDHQHCSMKWLNRSNNEKRTDSDLLGRIESEEKYWIEIWKRVVNVVRFLSIRGLAFRGNHEVFGVLDNVNYLGILELIAKYLSIIADSTSDLSHIDQLSIVIRHCLNGKVYERFLTFIPIQSNTGESLALTILQFLEKENIDITNCRAQTYDNAANMSGKYSGVRARIKELNDLALYVPCVDYSLNLVGDCSAKSYLEAIIFS